MYFLCSSQRTGSTMLDDLLKRMQVLGTPGEHFRLFLGVQKKKRITYNEIVPQILKNYQTQNGVFGVKIQNHIIFTNNHFSENGQKKRPLLNRAISPNT